MQLDPMDVPPAARRGVRRRSQEFRLVVAVATVVLTWMLTTTAVGPQIGSATALLAAVLVPAFLFREHITWSRLPYVFAFGAPVLIGGLWLS